MQTFYEVEIGYRKYTFDCFLKALQFAQIAFDTQQQSDSVHIEIKRKEKEDATYLDNTSED